MERIILMAVTIITLITGLSIAAVTHGYTEGYLRGYNDAIADAHYEHGHGYDPSCPRGHSAVYCMNYQAGYQTGWSYATSGGGQGGPYSQPQLGPQTESQESWTLTVYLKPAFGTTSLYVEAYGPFGDHVGDTFVTGVGASATLQLPQSEFPSGYYFKIGVGTDASSITYYGSYTSNGQDQTFTYELGGLHQ
jgi:hypothetical protein